MYKPADDIGTNGRAGDARGEVAVSVIFVSYNTRELTLNAVESIYGSIVDPTLTVEVIVVDNDSRDGSAEAVERRFPAARVVRSGGNIGFGRGNNLGAEAARGTMLLLLNTDTIVRRGAIEALYDTFRRDPRCGVAGARLENSDGSYQQSVILLPTVWRTFCTFFWLELFSGRIPIFAGSFARYHDPDTEQEVEVAHGAALMIRRELFERTGGFDPDYFMYFEECDLCRRVADLGMTVRFVPGARVLHLEGQSSRERPGWIYRLMRESRMVFFRKHGGPVERVLVTAIVHVGYAARILLYGIAGVAAPRLRRLGRNILFSYIDTVPVFASGRSNQA